MKASKDHIDRFDMEYLTKDNPPVETIGAHARILDAIEEMCDKDYSQLPVVEEKGVCVGAVTTLPFLQVLRQQLEKGNEGINEIMKWPVTEFMVPCEHAEPHELVLDRIDVFLEKDSRRNFVLVGSQTRCDSIATKSNVVRFFENKAIVFLLLAEIETSLRYMTEKYLTPSKLEETLASLRSSRKERKNNAPINDIEDLSFDELKAIINKNWNTFEKRFKDKNRTNKQLEYIRDLRNKVFHFRAKIGFSEMNHVKELRDNFFKIAEESQRVLLVCSGNEHRSKAGEDLLRKVEGLDVKSAGTLSLLPPHVEVSKDLVEWADIVFAMEKTHKDEILGKWPEVGDKIVILDIPDDYSSKNDPELIAKLKTALSPYFPRILEV